MRTCPNCGSKVEPDWRFCMNCSTAIHPTALAPSPVASAVSSETGPAITSVSGVKAYPIAVAPPLQFPVARMVGLLLKAAAVVLAIGGLVAGIEASDAISKLAQQSGVTPDIAARITSTSTNTFLVLLGGGLLLGLFSWALAEFIGVTLAVEENTRAIRLGVR